MYSIEFSQNADKQLSKLDDNIKERIINSLERIRIRPHHFIERLVSSPFYKLRVGEYRVILDIQDYKMFIFVVELGHRKNIYK